MVRISGTDIETIMSLKDWAENRWLRPHQSNSVEIEGLFSIVDRDLQHYRTIAALPLVLGKERDGDAAYLEACRTKRNTAEYDMVIGSKLPISWARRAL